MMDTSGLPPDLTCPGEGQWPFPASFMGESEYALWVSHMELWFDSD